LKGDGKFELQGREGEYLVSGHWVELNGTVLKSRAKIEAGHKIVFRFTNKKGACEMIYERRVAELGKTKLS
jgi:ribosomal 50S subunit-recycling heat shock protein